MSKKKTEDEILHEPFDIETHKRTFVNYLELVIDKDGKAMYAIPSHQQVVLSILHEKGFTDDDLYQHPTIDLALLANVVLVWDKYKEGIPNKKQKETMRALRDAGLYTGEIDPVPIEEFLKQTRNNLTSICI